MAVDSAAKRFAMMSFGQTSSPVVFEPDGTVDADDRADLLFLYGGIALASIGVNTAAKRFAMMSFGYVPPPLVFEPDGTVDADDRAQLLSLYGGNLFAGAETSGQLLLLQEKTLQGGLR